MTSLDVVMTLLGVIVCSGAVLTVISRHVVHASLWLVITLAGVAGCYLVLGAEVLALAQVLVYVGAVVVLVLVALMLTRAPVRPSEDLDHPWPVRVAGAVLGAGTAGLLAWALVTAYGGSATRVRGTGEASGEMAESIFGTFVWPFELLSVVLLSAVVVALATFRLGRARRVPEGGEHG